MSHAAVETLEMKVGTRSFPTLNFVRAIGATMVVTTHVGFDTGRIMDGWTGAVIGRMDFGVTIFFVLSGFLLSRPFFFAIAQGQPTPDLGHYLWKRALRILPLYWLVVVVALVFDPRNESLGWKDWVAQLTFTQLYSPGLLPHSLTQMWSLATEVVFYILLPLIVWALTRTRTPGLHLRTVGWRLAVLCLLGLAWQSYFATVPGEQGHFNQWLPGYFAWFAAGLWFAAVQASQHVSPRRTVLDRWGSDLLGCWVLATALFAIACTPIAGSLSLQMTGAWTAGIKSVLYTAAGTLYLLPLVFGPEREGRVREFMSRPVPSWLGEISYGIFCLHLLVVTAAFSLWEVEIFTGHFGLIWATTMIGTLALSSLAYVYLEKPMLGFKNRGALARRARNRSAAPHG